MVLLLSLGGEGLVGAQLIWGVVIIGALILFASVYLVVRLRAQRNTEIIGAAVTAMLAAMADRPAPQRALLGAIADLLVTQDRIAAKIEFEIHELTLSDDEIPPPEEFLKELVALPEPQILITEFLAEHGASLGSAAAFTTVAADLVSVATLEIFGDLPGNTAAAESVELERLLLRAAEGSIARVAEVILEGLGSSRRITYSAPRVSDLDAGSMTAIVRRLDQLTRRHLRLAALLHGQAEAALRIGGERERSLGGRLARAWRRLSFARPRHGGFGTDDLDALVTAFDATGEAVGTAADYLAEGRPTSAMHLLAGLRVPVPPGLPGRMYHQASLAEVRPLAAFGVWHRLELCRWVISALQAMIQAEQESPGGLDSATVPPDDDVAPGDGDGR